VTHTGLGTPRYMAPEQVAGAPLTPATDQYAFCVSLRESLLAIGPTVPRWLEGILRRGTAAAPAARFPSMERLLAALALDPRTRWSRRAIAGAAVGVAIGAFAVGRADRAEAPSCDGGAAEIAAVWSDGARAVVNAHLGELGTPYALQARAHVIGVLDGYGARWRAVHRAGCLAHRDATLSTPMFDRRAACLARARAAFAAAVDAVWKTTGGQLPDAVAAAAQLPDLGRCVDPELLMAGGAGPPPAAAAAVAALSDEVASLEVQLRAARAGVRKRIDDAIAQARALGYPPLLARALRLAGIAAIIADARVAAIAPLDEATRLALTAGEYALAVETYARRVWAEGTSRPEGASTATSPPISRPDRALVKIELIEALAASLPASARASRALLDSSIGSAQQAAGRTDRARDAFERALGHAHGVTGPAALELAGIRTNLALVVSDSARQLELARERRAIVEAALDGGHPMVLDARISAALFEPAAGSARAALAPPCAAYVQLWQDRGAKILDCQYELGMLALVTGDRPAARAAFALGAATASRGGGGNLLALARAYTAMLGGDLAGAAREVDELFRTLGRIEALSWWQQLDAGDAWLARAEIAAAEGQPAAARAAFEATRRIFEPVLAAHHIPRYLHRLERAEAALASAP